MVLERECTVLIQFGSVNKRCHHLRSQEGRSAHFSHAGMPVETSQNDCSNATCKGIGTSSTYEN